MTDATNRPMEKTVLELRLPDRRRTRAMPIVHAIIHIVRKYVREDRESEALRDLSHKLFEKMHRDGAEIITDADRAEAGLPPRGPDGWTMEELALLEARRMERMEHGI